MSISYNEDDFSLVVLAKVQPEKELPTDIFLKINGKLVKFKSKGDMISGEKYNLFVSKGLKNIYIPTSNILKFVEWINDTEEDGLNQLIDDGGEENQELFEETEKIREQVYEVFFEEDLSAEIVEKLQSTTEQFISKVKEKPISEKAIAALIKRNATIADHSLNVAYLSIYLGMVLGHSHQFVLENIYIGSILHDFAKAKISEELLENKNDPVYEKAFLYHPIDGVKMVRHNKQLNNQIITIILEHHEQWDGEGFPNGISGGELYELSQIVSMANTFDNFLFENQNLEKPERYKLAINTVIKGKGTKWSPKFYPRVVDALQLAFAKEL